MLMYHSPEVLKLVYAVYISLKFVERFFFREERLFLRKIIESAYIKENKERCMNLNEGIRVSKIYRRGKGTWIKREKQGI